MKLRPSRILTACVLSAVTLNAFAEWSEWHKMDGSGLLSMRSADSGEAGCAFAFRNDSNRTLGGAKIHYIHSGRVDNDILPALGPGQSLGGWTAFSVQDTCANVRVQIYDESWR